MILNQSQSFKIWAKISGYHCQSLEGFCMPCGHLFIVHIVSLSFWNYWNWRRHSPTFLPVSGPLLEGLALPIGKSFFIPFPHPLLFSHLVVSDSLRPHGLELTGSSVHGILQARILQWVAMLSSRESSRPRESNPCVSHCRQILNHLSHRESTSYFLVKTLGGPMSSTLVQYPPLWDSWLASHQQRTLVWQGMWLASNQEILFLAGCVGGVHRARTQGQLLGAEGGSSQHHSGNWGAQLLAGRKQDAANTLLQSRIKHVSLSAKVIPQLSLRWDQPSLVHTLTAILWDLQAEARVKPCLNPWPTTYCFK